MMARGINKVILIGNLGADPEVRYMPTGGAVANITIATSESWTDKATNEKKEATEWHRLVIYNRLAEVAGEYLRKGSKIYVEGKLKTRKWQDQQGVERYTTEIIVNEIQMLDGVPAASAGAVAGAGQGYQQPAQGQRTAAPAQGGYQQRPATGGFQPQGNFNQPQGGFNQVAAHRPGGPMEPPIDFDDDIPF